MTNPIPPRNSTPTTQTGPVAPTAPTAPGAGQSRVDLSPASPKEIADVKAALQDGSIRDMLAAYETAIALGRGGNNVA